MKLLKANNARKKIIGNIDELIKKDDSLEKIMDKL
jgi:hypothetical protein